MHFHLLKPLHGWRAFLGEVGVVVLGVLLALTAQQAAEALQWRSETATLRKSLHREIRDNQWNAALSVMISDCVRQRIKRFDKALAQAGSWHGDPMQAGGEQRWAALPPAFKFPSVEGFYTTGNWQTALTSGALAHMPEAERNGYSYTYQAMGDLRTLSIEQDRLAAELQPLARAIARVCFRPIADSCTAAIYCRDAPPVWVLRHQPRTVRSPPTISHSTSLNGAPISSRPDAMRD